MDASVIILTKNAGSRFEELMKKLGNQSYQDFEIIVIDSGSVDGTLKIAKRYGCRIHEIKPEEFHHSKTRNLGAKIAKGDYLIYITQDALPIDNKFLENLIKPLENDEIAGVYGRQIAYPNAKPMEKFFYLYFYPEERKVITSSDLGNLVDFYVSNVYISDVCSAMKKEVWKKINFDESIIMAEDKKWAIDVLKSGYKLVYEPKAIVYHSHNYSIISTFRRRFNDGVAMKQICGSGKVTSKGLSYFVGEMKYLLKNHKIWVPYALVYNVARFAGVFLGMHYEYIPNVLRDF
ncbi:MAG: glycosyltransferase family 2 protein [Archaeoglobaceae archaeon]|nr:glycosyltransferase family 2 protein [Archaeoglobaceae archaeon]